MAIFQFKCDSCSSIFEHLISSLDYNNISCISCGGDNIGRVDSTYFYPNKNFCPHDKVLDGDKLKTELGGIMNNTTQRCGGCGTDGSPGKCSSKGGGCGGGCSCKKGACSSPKLTMEI
ncbi:MAG: zinc ribbon domain-containing protein [Deltaproteobacteria bacterium]|nr:zinc ribbon domain-containing protein [Deltaproteobacteria bacterium]